MADRVMLSVSLPTCCDQASAPANFYPVTAVLILAAQVIDLRAGRPALGPPDRNLAAYFGSVPSPRRVPATPDATRVFRGD